MREVGAAGKVCEGPEPCVDAPEHDNRACGRDHHAVSRVVRGTGAAVRLRPIVYLTSHFFFCASRGRDVGTDWHARRLTTHACSLSSCSGACYAPTPTSRTSSLSACRRSAPCTAATGQRSGRSSSCTTFCAYSPSLRQRGSPSALESMGGLGSIQGSDRVAGFTGPFNRRGRRKGSRARCGRVRKASTTLRLQHAEFGV